MHDSGGKTPCWTDTITFSIGSTTELSMTVKDEDTCSDDLIGDTRINLEPVMKSGQFKDWVTIHFEGKEAGSIFLEMLYMAEGGSKAEAAPAAAPQPGMQTTTTVQYQMPPGGMPQ